MFYGIGDPPAALSCYTAPQIPKVEQASARVSWWGDAGEGLAACATKLPHQSFVTCAKTEREGLAMPQAIKLDSAEFAFIQVNDAKSWSFTEITDDQGVTAVIEFQNVGGRGKRDVVLAGLLDSLRGTPVPHESHVERLLGLTTPQVRADSDLASAVSALRTAVVELRCQHDGRGMTEALGGTPKDSVLLYANINRYLQHVLKRRTPADFARAAEGAAREGFTVLKTDPFDEVRPTDTLDEIKDTARLSLKRLAAMRSAVGPDVQLQVDCHGSFNLETAAVVAEDLEKLGVTFFEDPLDYTPQAEGLGLLYEKVNLPLVAGGSGYGEDYFADLVEKGRVSITMQDVQRCGGVGVAARAGFAAARAGVKTSCHSPFGPLSLLASAHVHAAVPDSHALEHAIWEAPWRADLVEPRERVQDGRLWFPGGKGLGATLNWHTLESNGGIRWKL